MIELSFNKISLICSCREALIILLDAYDYKIRKNAIIVHSNAWEEDIIAYEKIKKDLESKPIRIKKDLESKPIRKEFDFWIKKKEICSNKQFEIKEIKYNVIINDIELIKSINSPLDTIKIKFKIVGDKE